MAERSSRDLERYRPGRAGEPRAPGRGGGRRRGSLRERIGADRAFPGFAAPAVAQRITAADRIAQPVEARAGDTEKRKPRLPPRWFVVAFWHAHRGVYRRSWGRKVRRRRARRRVLRPASRPRLSPLRHRGEDRAATRPSSNRRGWIPGARSRDEPNSTSVTLSWRCLGMPGHRLNTCQQDRPTPCFSAPLSTWFFRIVSFPPTAWVSCFLAAPSTVRYRVLL